MLFGTLGACASFASVRKDAVDLVADVRACKAADTCVMMPAFDRDCTGVLGCPFPIRAGREAETVSRGDDIVERSRSTNECATAFCDTTVRDTAMCDPAAGRCVVVPLVAFDAGGDAPVFSRDAQ